MKKEMKRKIEMKRLMFAVVLSVAMMFAFGGVQAFAADSPADDPDLPDYTYVEKVKPSLSISKGTATSGVVVKDYDGDTTSISATITLQKYSSGNWVAVKSWSKTTASNMLSMSQTKAVAKGKYRVKAVVKAYKSKKYETITKYSGTVTY